MEHGKVTDILVSPDSKVLVSRIATSMMWGTTTGQKLPLPSINRTIKVWDVEAGCSVHELIGGWESVSSIAISSDSKLLAFVSDDATIRIWSLDSGTCAKRLPGFKRGMNSVDKTWVAFWRDSRSPVAGSYGDRVVMWSQVSGQWKLVFESAQRNTSAVSFSHDGESFAIVSANEPDTVVVDGMTTGDSLRSYQGNGDRVHVLVFSDYDSVLGFTSNSDYDGRYIIHVRSPTASGLNLKLRATHRQTQLTFSPNSKLLAATSGWNSVDIWDLSTRKVVWGVNYAKGTSISSFALARDWRLLFSASGIRTIKVWDTGSPLALSNSVVSQSGQSQMSPTSIFSSAKKMLRGLVSSTDHTSENTNSHDKPVDSLRFSPEGEVVISTSADRSIKFFNSSTGRCFKTLRGDGYKWFNYGMTFSHDSKLPAWPSEDCAINIIDTPTANTYGNSIKVYDNIRPLAISYSSRLLAVA